MNAALWTVQILLALLFLWAGGLKLVLPIEDMTRQFAFPGWFLRFLGVVEMLGAVGLLLPGLLRIRPGLTPLAAAGLVIVMIGATVVTWNLMGSTLALIPLASGLLALFVAIGRWRFAPLRSRAADLSLGHRA